MRPLLSFGCGMCIALMATGVAVSQPVSSAAQHDWSDPYVGAHAGYSWREILFDQRLNTVSGIRAAPFTYDAEGALGGFQVGYNTRVARSLFVGVEADVTAANVYGSVVQADLQNRIKSESRVRWLATLRGRLGIAYNSMLFYGTAGLAWIDGNQIRTQLAEATNQARAGVVG